jgi:predicted O-methyltransferase YrrM
MLPKVEPSKFLQAGISVCVRERYSAVDGNVTAQELKIISQLVKLTESRVLFEIGTFNGRTTLNLAAHSPAEARIYTPIS